MNLVNFRDNDNGVCCLSAFGASSCLLPRVSASLYIPIGTVKVSHEFNFV